jgi:hypothetical protein
VNTVAPSIKHAAIKFLRGDTSVPEFTYAFQDAVQHVAAERPLDGLEVEIHESLEAWEAAGWQQRPEIVDRLRALSRAATAG